MVSIVHQSFFSASMSTNINDPESSRDEHESSEEQVRLNFFPRIHSPSSLALSITAYFLGGAMLTANQSNPIVFLSTFTSGSFFMANSFMNYKEAGLTERDKCFNDVLAGWLWTLASLRQFMHHRTHRWCGYSSWTAFAATSVLMCRWMWVYSTQDINSR